MAICEQCGKDHTGEFGSGRFCCRSCSNRWVALHQSPEAKAKKVAKGKSNLRSQKGWRLSPEQRLEASRKGGLSRSRAIRERRKKMLDESLISGVFPEDYNIKGLLKWDIISLGYIDYKCSVCGNEGVWKDKPLTLQLHHKDGNNSNNKLTNLSILCPNCHSQTDTFSWRNTFKSKGD